MPFELPLPLALKRARWRVKIREKETCEPPHVTILRGTRSWRINLRTGAFLDRWPDPAEVPLAVLNHIRAEVNWQRLCEEWDQKYPANPVREHLADAEGDSDDSHI